jgi:hypothetical protein
MHEDETDDDARERLNQLRPQLQAEGYDPVGPYRDLWQQALNGVFPATQINGRWFYKPKDIPVIARALKLKKRQRVVA